MNYCVLDICCGTMSVSKALRLHHPSARIISFDVDPKCGLEIIDLNHGFRLGDVRNIDPAELKREVGNVLSFGRRPLARNIPLPAHTPRPRAT